MASHVAEGAVARELASEALGFFGEATMGDGAVKKNAEDGGLDGLFEEPIGAEIVHGCKGGFDVTEGGEDDGGDLNAFNREAAQEFKAVHARHLKIGDENGDGISEELFEGFLAVGGGIGRETPTADDGGEAGALGFFVVCDENAGDGKRRGDGHEGANSFASALPMVGCTLSSMVALELQARYQALVARMSGDRQAGEEAREQLTGDLSAAREFVNGVNRALADGADETLTALLEDGEGFVDRLEAQVYLIQEIGLEAFREQQG